MGAVRGVGYGAFVQPVWLNAPKTTRLPFPLAALSARLK